jgi:hypothetical protein
MSGAEVIAPPAGSPARVPLSFTQEFLTMFSTGEETGPFGPRYHVVRGLRFRGDLDIDVLRGALDDVVARHESLRTLMTRDGDSWHQEILPPCSPGLETEQIPAADPRARDLAAEEFLDGLEDTDLSSRRIPHIRAVLGRLDPHDAVLGLQAHHVGIDGWSMQLIMRDLVNAYAVRTGHAQPDAAGVSQYREFSAWQRESLADGNADRAREYWRDKLRGARMLGIPTDRRRPADVARTTSVYRYVVDAGLTSALLTMSRTARCTPFMVLLAAYQLLLREVTGVSDVTIPTITFGRGHPRFDDTVGPFFNFIPLRTDLTGCQTGGDVLARTRTTVIQAQTHEIPFAYILGEAPELMATFGDDSVAVCAFQSFQNGPNGGRIGNLDYTELRRRVLFQQIGSDIPDGALWTMEIDPSGEVFGCIRFDDNQFGRSTVEDLAGQFQRVLRNLIGAPGPAA